MAFLIGGANSASGGYEIDNSLRVDDGDDVDLTFTPDSDGNKRVMTMSCWVKRSNLGGQHALMGARGDSTGISKLIRFQGTDNNITINHVIGNADKIEHVTNRKFRDISAWYHIVLALDTREAASTDGLKLYINGVRETSFATSTYTQNTDLWFNNDTIDMLVGTNGDADQPFDGYIAEFHWIDGTMKAASDFGETNDDGIWIPKQYSGSYGDNGFYLEFKGTGTSQNSSGIGADTSGNDNHFAVTNIAATDITTDTPTNNFCTLSPVAKDPNITLTEGNLKFTSGGSGGVVGTQAVANGKWYWEVKAVDTGADCQIGIWDTNFSSGFPYNQYVGVGESWGYINFNGKPVHNGSQGGAITTIGDDDIVMMALDMDNLKMWFGINGTWLSSGDPAAGSGEQHSGITDSFMTPAIASFSGTSGYDWQFNFGNPIYANSSSQADDNGYGDFEYDVPTGFYSLCTKNLAEFG
jgi:hypothetical protein